MVKFISIIFSSLSAGQISRHDIARMISGREADILVSGLQPE